MSSLAESVRSWASHAVVVDRRARAAVAVAAFALATALGAQVAVDLPFTPVPVTLQTFFVILAGVVLGPRLGAVSIAAYVLAGAAGLPVFANGAGGLPALLGPTGGYLLAAPAAAAVAGATAGRERTLLRTLLGLTLGTATMYVGGVLQLAAVLGVPLPAAAALGATPFLAGDAAKVVAALLASRAAEGSSFRRL
ncbi:MAG TPA: biotin transporter BioY [Longimicrobiales bacterium]|nr:biotin transporter BioY [Longimicrobiales bacterium]